MTNSAQHSSRQRGWYSHFPNLILNLPSYGWNDDGGREVIETFGERLKYARPESEACSSGGLELPHVG